MTHFIAIFPLLWWPGAKPTISLSHACIYSITPLPRQENWGSARLGNLPKVTGQLRFKPMSSWLWNLCSSVNFKWAEILWYVCVWVWYDSQIWTACYNQFCHAWALLPWPCSFLLLRCPPEVIQKVTGICSLVWGWPWPRILGYCSQS